MIRLGGALPQVLAFNVEWYDSNAQIVRNMRLNCYNDETLELVRGSRRRARRALESARDTRAVSRGG